MYGKGGGIVLKKKIVIIAACLLMLISGAVLLCTSLHYLGLFLVVVGGGFLLYSGLLLFAQKHTVHCPSCNFEVIRARQEYNCTGICKCPKCGAIIFADSQNYSSGIHL